MTGSSGPITQRPQPVAYAAVIRSVISSGIKVLIVLGIVKLTGEQVAILLLFTDNVIDLVTTLWARDQVTPIDAPRLKAGTEVQVADADWKATGATTTV